MTDSDLIPVTVVLRSYNDAPLLPRTLAGLDRQRGVKITLFVFESASTDGSQEIFERHGYDRIEHLKPGTYHSSTVLNTGASWAKTELVAFVNSDAILLGDDVLLLLAQALGEDERCAGAFARQVVRPDATVMTRLDYDIAFEHRHELGDVQDHMSLVTSMIRRRVWEECPFDASLTFAEDFVWSSRVKARGYRLQYVPRAVVEHSHDYAIRELYRRAYGDSAALASVAVTPPPRSLMFGFLIPFAKRCVRDTYRLARLGRIDAVWRLPVYRAPWMLGEWQGTVAGWDHFHGEPERRGAKQPTAASGARVRDVSGVPRGLKR